MKRTVITSQNVFGNDMRFITYEPIIPSNNWLIFLHGRGECASAESGQLAKVENPTSYAKHAKTGHEFPFNIIAPQCTSSFTTIITQLPYWLRAYKNADIIGMKGLSLGAQACFNAILHPALQGSKRKPLDFIVPISGRPDDSTAVSKACSSLDVDVYSMHGTKDTTVPFNPDEAFCKALQVCPDRQGSTTFVPVVNGGHDTWNQAFALDENNPVWKFIHDRMKAKPTSSDQYVLGYETAKIDATKAIENL